MTSFAPRSRHDHTAPLLARRLRIDRGGRPCTSHRLVTRRSVRSRARPCRHLRCRARPQPQLPDQPLGALGGERVLREIQAMAPRLVSLDAWRNEFLTSAERALAAGRTHDAAILLRSAEFFMTSADPRKRPSRERFLALMRQAYGVGPPERVPFAGGYLPFHRFVPPAPRATVGMFGGVGSYVRELFPILTANSGHWLRLLPFGGSGS